MNKSRVAWACILILSAGPSSLRAGSTLEVIEKNRNSEDASLSVQRKLINGQIDLDFKSVQCEANPGHYPEVTCHPIELQSKKFLLIDCFGHDAVCQSCRVMKFNFDGTQDDSFKIPFAISHKDLMNSSPNEIKDIHKVEVTKDNDICIKGSFISSLVNWTRKEAEEALEKSGEPGDVGGKPGIVCLSGDGNFKSFVPDPNPGNWKEKGGRE